MKCNEELIHAKVLPAAHYNRKCMYSSQTFIDSFSKSVLNIRFCVDEKPMFSGAHKLKRSKVLQKPFFRDMRA